MMITKVEPTDDYCLKIELGSGGKIFMDCNDLLQTIRFCQLRDKTIFKSARVSSDGCYIEFSDRLRFGASEIMNIILTPKN